MKIKPLKDRVLIKCFEKQTKSEGGLYLPEDSQKKPNEGEVIAIGLTVACVKVGDTVLYDKFSGAVIKIDEVEHLIVKEEDILGVMYNEPETP